MREGGLHARVVCHAHAWSGPTRREGVGVDALLARDAQEHARAVASAGRAGLSLLGPEEACACVCPACGDAHGRVRREVLARVDATSDPDFFARAARLVDLAGFRDGDGRLTARTFTDLCRTEISWPGEGDARAFLAACDAHPDATLAVDVAVDVAGGGESGVDR